MCHYNIFFAFLLLWNGQSTFKNPIIPSFRKLSKTVFFLYLTFPVRPSRSWRSICSNRLPRSVWNCTEQKSYFAKRKSSYLRILFCEIEWMLPEYSPGLHPYIGCWQWISSLSAHISLHSASFYSACNPPPPLERRCRHAQQKILNSCQKGNCRPSLPAGGRETLLLIDDSFAADICLCCTAGRLHFIPCDDDMGSCNKM